MYHTEGVTREAGRASLSEPHPPHASGVFMLRRFTRRVAKTKALKLDPPSMAQGGLAFILAYTIAYAFFAR